MTDWIEHTTDTCPVDPGTVVEVRYRNPWKASLYWLGWHLSARSVEWRGRDITHYRIITPAPTPPLFLGGDPAKPSEPEMTKTAQERAAAMFATAIKPEPDLITLRLECLKLALQESSGTDYQRTADIFLHYVLNGSVDKA
jgi:hypothetical protein